MLKQDVGSDMWCWNSLHVEKKSESSEQTRHAKTVAEDITIPSKIAEDIMEDAYDQIESTLENVLESRFWYQFECQAWRKWTSVKEMIKKETENRERIENSVPVFVLAIKKNQKKKLYDGEAQLRWNMEV